MRVAFAFLPPWDPTFPSYAMALFKASTQRCGHEFVDCDVNVDLFAAATPEDRRLWHPQVANRWMADQEQILERFGPHLGAYVDRMLEAEIDLYAFSMNYYSTTVALWMAERIKRSDPGALVIGGGPQCLPAYAGVALLDHPALDAICTGEGDLVWPRVLEHVERQGDLRVEVPGIAYRAVDGRVVDQGPPELVRDLDALPFADYSDLDYREYGGEGRVAIMTSRGCVNTCAFCSERPNFSRYRHRSAENVYAEISEHVRLMSRNVTAPRARGSRPHVHFNDSLVNGAPRELEKLCDLIIAGGLDFRWGGMALIRKEMTPALLHKMRRAGCTELAWGLESGSQRVLDLMHKRFFTMDLAKQVIVWTKEAGITQSISLIAGFPGETEEMFEETRRFVAEYRDCFAVGVQPMMIARNSTVHEEWERFGIADRAEWLRWKSTDGTNDYGTRLRRVESLRADLAGRVQTIDK